MDANRDETDQLRTALAGARARIEELAANGRRIITLEQQIGMIRAELDTYLAVEGEATAILDGARAEATQIVGGARAHAREIAVRAEEILASADRDADLLRAAALEEGAKKAAALLEEARLSAHQIRTAAHREAARIGQRTEAASGEDAPAACAPDIESTSPPELVSTPAMTPGEAVARAGSTFRSRHAFELPRLGIEETDIWAKATRKP